MTSELDEDLPPCVVCGKPSWYWVEASWTVADFEQVDVCIDHLNQVMDHFEAQRVEDLEPLVSSHTYWPGGMSSAPV
jgi:hypothetical protein